jgi:hypothetical protein
MIGIDGCEMICCAMSPEEAFHRAFRYQEFDITELSLSNTMDLVAKGACPYVGIPGFRRARSDLTRFRFGEIGAVRQQQSARQIRSIR